MLDVARGDPVTIDGLLNGKTMADAITGLDVTDNTITAATTGFSSSITLRQY